MSPLSKKTALVIRRFTANTLRNPFFTNYSNNNTYSNFGLSGKRETPLYVDEPKFVIIRKEDESNGKLRLGYQNDPFIPPRGRKQLPALKKFYSHHEPFFPNRGKKDKLADIFKYDETFFPNRGKKYIQNDFISTVN